MTKIENQMRICSFYIKGHNLKPNTIEEVLGVRAHKGFQRGEKRQTHSGSEVEYKNGLYCIRSQDNKNADFIRTVVDLVHQHREKISEINEIEEMYFDIIESCDDNDGRSVQIERDVVAMIASIGAEIRFTCL